jgi:peptidoglycan/LPS O-acetylase OafA/YrhL
VATVTSKKSLVFLDGLRGLAAFYVMVGHARWLLWEGYSDGYAQHPGDYSAFEKGIMYFLSLFRYGHQSVLLFFVLSGFVIHLKYARQLKAGGDSSFGFRDFFYRRAKRLYPPLLFALLTTTVLDSCGTLLQYRIYFQKTPYSLINTNVVPHFSWMTGIGNLLFLMTTVVPVWGSNGPLWSLHFEWWFYMLYPLFWRLSKRSIAWATGSLACLYVLFMWGHIPVPFVGDIVIAMLAWWFGVLLADMYTGRFQFPFWAVALLTPLLGVMLVVPFGNALMQDTFWGLGFSGLLALCFWWQECGGSLVILEKLKPLGDMSYTLYITHFPLFVFFSGWLMSRSAAGVLPGGFFYVLCGIVGARSVSYAGYLLVEKPFMSQRKPAVKRELIVAPLQTDLQ